MITLRNSYCERCGQPRRYAAGDYERYDVYRAGLGDGLPAGLPSFSEYIREAPARTPEPAGDVAVPALQALISGVAVTVLGLGVIMPTGGSWWWAPVIGAGVASVTWFVLLSDSRRLLRHVERVIGQDVDADGHVGEPEPEPVPAPIVHKLEVREQTGKTSSVTRLVDLPAWVTDDVLASIARAVVTHGEPFSRRGLERACSDVDDYNAKYSQLQDVLSGAGLLRLKGKSKNAGYEPTAALRSWLRRVLDESED